MARPLGWAGRRRSRVQVAAVAVAVDDGVGALNGGVEIDPEASGSGGGRDDEGREGEQSDAHPAGEPVPELHGRFLL